MAQSWFQKYGTYEEEIFESGTGITAYAGGGQALATPLTKKFNRVDTVANQNASVKLPAAKVGKKCFVLNNAGLEALVIVIFPQVGEYIDGVLNAFDFANSIYTSRIPGAGGIITYECYEDGKWSTIINPKIFTLHKEIIVTEAQIKNSHTAPVTLIPSYGQLILDPVSILHTSITTQYTVNTNINITTDSGNALQPHYTIGLGAGNPFTQWKKCLPFDGAYLERSHGLYLIAPVGNPSGGTGGIKLRVTYNLYLD